MAIEVTTDLIKDYFTSIAGELIDLNGDNLQELGPSVPQELAQFIIEKADIQEGDVILDAGSGTGYIDVLITQQFARTEIIALDICPEFIKRAETITVKTGADRNRFKPKEGDFTKLSHLFEPNTFDKILFLESILYSPSLIYTLMEAKKVLKPEGQIIIKDVFCLAPNNSKKEFEEFYAKNRQVTLRNVVTLSQLFGMFESLGLIMRYQEYIPAHNQIKLPSSLSMGFEEEFKKILPKMLNVYINGITGELVDVIIFQPAFIKVLNSFEDQVISNWSYDQIDMGLITQ